MSKREAVGRVCRKCVGFVDVRGNGNSKDRLGTPDAKRPLVMHDLGVRSPAKQKQHRRRCSLFRRAQRNKTMAQQSHYKTISLERPLARRRAGKIEGRGSAEPPTIKTRGAGGTNCCRCCESHQGSPKSGGELLPLPSGRVLRATATHNLFVPQCDCSWCVCFVLACFYPHSGDTEGALQRGLLSDQLDWLERAR